MLNPVEIFHYLNLSPFIDTFWEMKHNFKLLQWLNAMKQSGDKSHENWVNIEHFGYCLWLRYRSWCDEWHGYMLHLYPELPLELTFLPHWRDEGIVVRVRQLMIIYSVADRRGTSYNPYIVTSITLSPMWWNLNPLKSHS